MPRVVHARDTRFGGYLEDFEVGDVFHHWPGKTITEAENHQFCMLTMAVNPVHIDAHYAAREMEHGRNLVVGTYIYALLVGMSVPDVSGRPWPTWAWSSCATSPPFTTATRSMGRPR